MGKKKLQRFAEMDTFKHVVQPSFDEVFKKDYKLKGKWSRTFFGNDNPLILELGCGKGEYTVGLARQCPDKNFIGIDIIVIYLVGKDRNIHLILPLGSANW